MAIESKPTVLSAPPRHRRSSILTPLSPNLPSPLPGSSNLGFRKALPALSPTPSSAALLLRPSTHTQPANRKAPATLSLTHTNTFHDDSYSQNLIPFPSSSTSASTSESCITLLRPTPDQANRSRTTHILRPAQDSTLLLQRKLGIIKRKRGDAVKQMRVITRRHMEDAHFLATLHKSISRRLETRRHTDFNSGRKHEVVRELELQDKILVDRLYEHLATLGRIQPPTSRPNQADSDSSLEDESAFTLDLMTSDITLLSMPQLVASLLLRRPEHNGRRQRRVSRRGRSRPSADASQPSSPLASRELAGMDLD